MDQVEREMTVRLVVGVEWGVTLKVAFTLISRGHVTGGKNG